MQKEIEVVGDTFIKDIPLYDGVSPLKTDVRELMLSNRWKPSFNILGIDKCTKKEERGFSFFPEIKFRASIRIPPLIEQDKAMVALKKALIYNTYFGTKISLGSYDYGDGVILANVSNRTKNILNKAS